MKNQLCMTTKPEVTVMGTLIKIFTTLIIMNMSLNASYMSTFELLFVE